MTAPGPVLVVEDDAPIREALLEIVQDLHVGAIAAENGREALDLLRSREPRPCLVLLDLMMPVMDGVAFRHEQLRDPALAGIPVVVLSAYTDASEKAKQLGVAGFLRKPFEARRVVEIVLQHCATESPGAGLEPR